MDITSHCSRFDVTFMSRFFAITFILILVNILVSTAQESTTEPQEFPKAAFGFKGGINLSTLSASINSETRAKPGLTVGMYLKKQIGPKFFFRPELYYSNQGQEQNYLYPYGGPSIGRTKTDLHYLNVPLLFELGRKLSLQFGAQVGVMVAGTEKGTIASVKIDEKLNDVMTPVDFALVVGLGYSAGDHFNCGARLNYGVTNIYKPDDDSGTIEIPDVHNRVFHFYIAWSF